MYVLQKKNMKRIPSVKNKDVIHRQAADAESECILNFMIEVDDILQM